MGKEEKINNNIPKSPTENTPQQTTEEKIKLSIHETLSHLPYTELTQENFPKIQRELDSCLLELIGHITGVKTQIGPTLKRYDKETLKRTFDTIIKESQKLEDYCLLFRSKKETLPLAYTKIADIIHKIKLSGISTMEIIEISDNYEEMKHVAQTAIKGLMDAKQTIQNMSYITNDILKTSEYNIYEATQNIIEEKKYAIQKNNITIENMLPQDTKIHSYQEIYASVIENLLSNAIKFVGNPGIIKIGIEEQTDKEISFYVEDNGKGIPDGIDVFVGGYTTQGNEGTKGTGLGLKLCKQYIDEIGGKISHTSGVNKQGTKFIITLPIEK